MTAPRPKTVASRVNDELTDFLLTAPEYLSENDPRFVGWLDDLTTGLQGRTRGETFLALAALAHTTGDIKYAESYLTRAESAGVSEWECTAKKVVLLHNLGYASSAVALARDHLLKNQSQVGFRPQVLAGIGAFGLLRQHLDALKANNVDLQAFAQASDMTQLASWAADCRVTDDEFAKVLDLAGTMLRARRLFWLDSAPALFYDEEMACAGVRFRIAVSPEEAAIMDVELLRSIVDSDLDRLPLTVGFVGALNDDGQIEKGYAS